jgi:RHS repeat-associated protein
MLIPGRGYNSEKYRFAFNGKESDNEWKGTTGAVYDYGFRIYDSRIAKFLSVDPLTKDYPWYTPYQFAGNKPIVALDIDGLEPILNTKLLGRSMPLNGKIMRYDDFYMLQWKHYHSIMKNNYIKSNGYSHDIDYERIKQETGKPISESYELIMNARYYLDKYKYQYFHSIGDKEFSNIRNNYKKEVKSLWRELEWIQRQKEIKHAELQEITPGDILSVFFDIGSLAVSLKTSVTGIGLAGLAISADNLIKDLGDIHDKLQETYEPENVLSGGEYIERQITGTDYIYDIVSIASSGKGAYKAFIDLKRSGKVVKSMEIFFNAGDSADDLQKLVREQSKSD